MTEDTKVKEAGLLETIRMWKQYLEQGIRKSIDTFESDTGARIIGIDCSLRDGIYVKESSRPLDIIITVEGI